MLGHVKGADAGQQQSGEGGGDAELHVVDFLQNMRTIVIVEIEILLCGVTS